MQNPYAMHSFLKHQAPKPPTRFHEDPELKRDDCTASLRRPGIEEAIARRSLGVRTEGRTAQTVARVGHDGADIVEHGAEDLLEMFGAFHEVLASAM